MLRILAVTCISIGILLMLGLIAFQIWSRAPKVNDSGLKEQVTAAPAVSANTGTRQDAEPTPPPADTDASEAQATPTPEPAPVRREDTYTLLVVGRDQVGVNTDSIMVVRMDCREQTVNVVSIPRDTLVNVPWEVKKVNSLYGVLGREGLLDGIEDLVGFPIDNYVVVNTFVFRELIDYIGGVNFYVPMYMYYDDPGQNLHIYLSPGYQRLNGSQAEQLVRFRQNNDGTGFPDGDIGRINLQHSFFQELARQVLSMGNIANLPAMINLVINNTDTDLTSGNIAFFAQEFLKMNSENVRFLTMPYDTVYILGGSYTSIQVEPWLDMINTYLNPFTTDVTAANLDVVTYTEAGFASTTGSAPGFASFYNYSAG